jgi:hypothetical protein
VLVLNADLGIPREQTLRGVEVIAVDIETDSVPLAGHAFAADKPDWTASCLVRFFGANK